MLEEPTGNPRPETLALLFDLARESPGEQLRASDAVDSKIFQTFAAASVLIGLAAIHNVKQGHLITAFVSAAVLAYLLAAAVATWALWSRRFRVGMAPRQLWDKYWSDEPSDIKHAYIDDIAKGFTENETHLKGKHRALRFVLISVLVEATAIGASLIGSTI